MHNLDEILYKATSNINSKFYELPIEGGPTVFRERVYCYELYHQMRCIWPNQSEYVLNGELDKRAHPALKKLSFQHTPDLLIHTPGNMAGNNVIIEIKCHATPNGIIKDMRTIEKFIKDANYKRGIYIVYGPACQENKIKEIIKLYKTEQISSEIELWIHPKSGTNAFRYSLLNSSI
jgi:hypothetical protein